MKCLKCGNKLTAKMNFCEKCGSAVDLAEIYSRQKKSFNLSEKEVEVRTYHCTTLEKPKAEGYVTVTNKRVIYHGHGHSSFMHSEVHMDKITGVRNYFGLGYNKKKIMNGIILILISIWLFVLGQDFDGSRVAGFITLIIAVILLLKSKEVSYNFAIAAEGGNSSAVQIGYMANASELTGQGAGISINAAPTKETKEMMRELGAIILDFQSLGDQAIKKWAPEKEIAEIVESEK